MAKRKNPLKDLDEFLKKEASSFVKPEKEKQPESSITSGNTLTSSEEIIAAMDQLASKDPKTYREELYKIIQSAIEHLDRSSAEDKMLINTILYLKDKKHWKENITAYWQEHS
ncbi:MAG: hypothetical protein R3345_09805 [Fulvivirga sp.]|nr:hypothetical protein [Fulvivirga sp.]